MNTQIIFKIDRKLKDKAVKKARKEGISLTDFYKLATKSFIGGRLDVGLVQAPEIPNARTARELQQAIRDVKAGRNLSPAFGNARDAIAYLKKHAG